MQLIGPGTDQRRRLRGHPGQPPHRLSCAKYNDLVAVVAGTTLGMMIVNIPTVLCADKATKWIPVKTVRIIAAAVYAVLGVATLLGYSEMKL
ncbi:MAG: hypothetical protein JWM63_1267 [Gammaproteobacteria bacterium]|nr:hypothetical protein [Gammaproteobacteria bacterium]